MDMMVRERKSRTVGIKEVKDWITSGESRSVIDVLVMPPVARELLKYNAPGETNRNLSRAYIDSTAAELRDGKWENTGEPVIMSDEGILNDGQHRLQAIVETGIGCIMDLRFGIRRHAFANTNSGRKRTGGDALVLAGVTESFATSATARLVLCYSRGLPRTADQRVSNGDIVAAVERWPDLIPALRVTKALRKPLRNAPTNALAFFAMRTANEASVAEFFDILRTGEGKQNNPPHLLRDYMMVTHSGHGHDTHTRVRSFAACILAWNAWRAPQKERKLNLYWKENQAFPVCEGLEL